MKHTWKGILCLLLALVLCMGCVTPALAEEGLFTLAGANMTLGNELSINFFIKKTDLKVTDGCTATIVHNGTAATAAIEPFNSIYHKVTCHVAAKQMADELAVQIFDADGNALSKVYTDSVRGYAMRALDADTSTDLVKTMVVDMLNYGAAAQAHFRYNTADPANGLLTEAQKALATDTVSCINGQIKGENCYGSNLSLEDRILFNMFFSGMKGKDVSSMYATVSFTGYDGKKHDIRVEGSAILRYTADIYRVVVDDIVLADSDCPVTVTVYNADGSIHGSATDSVESYNARAAASDTHGLYDSIMRFFRSAYLYLTDKNGIETHDWNTGELTKAATDTEIGTIVYTCLDENCGATREKTVAAGVELLTRADLEAALEEVSWDYLLKKDKIQYDSMELGAVGKYYGGKFLVTEDGSLEKGTSHTEINSVCSDYVWKVYEEALDHHIFYAESSLEVVTLDMWLHAEDQIRLSDEEDIDSCLVRWQSLAFTDEERQFGVPDSPHFVDTKEEVFEYFLNWETMLRPGDVLVDKGHALIYAGNGKVLHCNGTKYQPTTGVLNHEDSGAVYGVSPLNCEDTSWLKTRANTGRLIVFRPNEFLVTRDTDGDLSNDLVRDLSFTMPEDTISRLAYPGMEIDRTVDITPFGTASVGQALTYSVKISNMSSNTKYMVAKQVADPAYTGVSYEALVVTETVPAGTQFVSATEGGVYDEATGTIRWTLDLAAGKTVTPSYTVKVTAQIGDLIVNGGGFVADIPSNTISNRVGGEKMNEFAAMTLKELAKSTASWDFGTGLAFAEKIYEAAETKLELPAVSDAVEELFVWTKAIGAIRNPSTRYEEMDPIDVFMRKQSDSPISRMLIDTYYGGYLFFTGDDAIGSTISEFRFDYLEPGDIIVNCDTANGAVTGAQVMVYAGDDTLLICNADGSYQILKGSAAKQQLWNSFLQTNELFFALRPSQAADLKAAHTWDDGTLTKAPTCAEEGEMTYICLDDGCGATKIKVLDKTTDHSWNENAADNGNGTHTLTCGLCGTTRQEAHTWDDGEGDSTEMVYTCTACGASKTEVGGLTAEQTALLQSFTYKKGNMSAAANNRQTPPYYADTIYAAICMDGLIENFNSYTAAGVLAQAFKLTSDSTDYGNYDRTYVLRTEANGYLTDGSTAYQVASMVVDGFYGGPWIVDADGIRLTDRGSTMDIARLQPGDVILMGENSAKFEAVLWTLVYQGVIDGTHSFLFGSSYYGGTYTNVAASSISYRGHLRFDARTQLLTEVLFDASLTGAGSVVELTMEKGVGACSFNDLLLNDPVSGIQWEYFYAIRPCKVMGHGSHTWDGDTCSVCGTVRSDDPHTCEGAYTDNSDGTHTFTCAQCGERTVSEHTWDAGTVSPDAVTYTCTLCGAARTEVTEPETRALTDAQISDLQALTYHKGSMTAAANSRQRPVHFADTIYAAIGLDGLVEKFNGGLTAASVLAQPFQRLDSNGSVFTPTGRSYMLRTAENGYLTVNGVTYETALMMVDGFYGGSWIVDADGDRLTDAADTMDIAELQPGDVLIMGENTGSYDALLWVLVYQGVLDGQHTFIFGNTYYGSNYTNVSATTSYRGKLCFDAKTGILERAAFNNSISSTGTEVTLTTEGTVGTFTFNDWLRKDLVSGVAWEYFYALRPGKVLQ
ncbi:MAG: DUF11 domain-containing protein [Oscillospiraceae bacterium]|nr:DUF11 domain-containing protein [Oscillospiraceae bacterium]